MPDDSVTSVKRISVVFSPSIETTESWSGSGVAEEVGVTKGVAAKTIGVAVAG